MNHALHCFRQMYPPMFRRSTLLVAGLAPLFAQPMSWAAQSSTTVGSAMGTVVGTAMVYQAPSSLPAKGTTGGKRGLEIPKPPSAGPATASKPAAPVAPLQGDKTAPELQGPGSNSRAEGGSTGEQGASASGVLDPFAPIPDEDSPARVARIYKVLFGARTIDDIIVKRALEELLREGEPALTGARNSLKSPHLPTLVCTARFLEQMKDKASAPYIHEALRRGAPTDAVRPLLDALAATSPALVENLFELADHRNAATRTRAAFQLQGVLQAKDVSRVEELEKSRRSETRQVAAQLYASLSIPQSVSGLLRLIEDPTPAVAFAAADSLARLGEPSTDMRLLDYAVRSPLNRAFGYACIALSLREELRSVSVPADIAGTCLSGVKMPDPFIGSACAAALASIGFRSEDVASTSYMETLVVPALVHAASGERYFQDFSSIHALALRRLALLTARDFGTDGPAWARWWAENKSGFRSNRAVFAMNENAIDELAIDVEAPGILFTLRGGKSEPSTFSREDEDYILTTESLRLLGRTLADRGILAGTTLPGIRGLEAARRGVAPAGSIGRPESIYRVRVRQTGQRKEVGALENQTWPDLLDVVKQCTQVRAGNVWQRYVPAPSGEERSQAIEAERATLAATPDQEVHAGRLMMRILDALPKLPSDRRALAYKDLLAIPNLDRRLNEARAIELAAFLSSEVAGDESATQLIKIASLPRTARACDALIEAAAGMTRSASRLHLPRILDSFGLEQATRYLDDPRPSVRAAAVDSLGRRAGQGATPVLIERLADRSEDVQLMTVQALAGRGDQSVVPALRATLPIATGPVYKAIIDALGRLRSVESFEVIWQATESPDPSTRMTALRAVGNLGDPRAADFLATYWVRLLQSSRPLAEEKTAARDALMSLRNSSMRDALRRCLEVQSPEARREVVLALAEIGDPAAVPALLLEMERAVDGTIRNAIITLTCVDFFTSGDAQLRYREWWELNRSVSASAWFAEACGKAGVGEGISQAVLDSPNAASAIPALNNVLVAASDWFLRSRAAEILNSIVGARLATVDRFTTVDDRMRAAAQYKKYYETKR